MYQEWLKNNTNHPLFYSTLLHFAALEDDPFTILAIYKKYREKIQNENNRHEIEKQMALLYELLGNMESAVYYYKLAFADPERWNGDILLLNPAKLMLIQGLYEQAGEWINRVGSLLEKTDYEYTEALFLLAKIYLLSQQKDKALQLLLSIRENYKKSPTLPKCLLALIELYLELGEENKAQTILSELKSNHSSTIEYMLAQLSFTTLRNETSFIDFYPLPYRFLFNIEKKTDTVPSRVDKIYSVCVGSFQKYINASTRLEDLLQTGIKTKIIEKSIKGVLYYRVVIENKYSYADAEELINRLNNLGYKESFLLNE